MEKIIKKRSKFDMASKTRLPWQQVISYFLDLTPSPDTPLKRRINKAEF